MLKIEKLSESKNNLKQILKRTDNIVLNNITFTLEPGNIYGLIGHNGAGKSTLLETICDLNKYKGNISINGVEINNSRDKIAFLSSKINLDNKAVKSSKYLAILDDFDINEFNRLITRFLGNKQRKKDVSRGEARLAQIATVLAFKKDIYLLDEPLAGLDFDAKLIVLEEIRNKALDNKIVVVSSHELDDINKSIDSAIFIKRGKLVRIADLDSIRENEGIDLKEAYLREYGGNLSD